MARKRVSVGQQIGKRLGGELTRSGKLANKMEGFMSRKHANISISREDAHGNREVWVSIPKAYLDKKGVKYPPSKKGPCGFRAGGS